MKVCHVTVAAVMIVVAAPNAFAQQKKTLSADLAAIIVQEAVQKCRADGVKVSVKVVDASNTMKAFLRDDGAGDITVEFAQLKINSVILTGRPSGSNPGTPQTLPGTTAQRPILPGGLGLEAAAGKVIVAAEVGGAIPIKVGNELIGAIGVSGAPSADKDIACANAGLAKVADKLK
jgi:uncharacterized protein GlcG (DUF336 family)